MESRVESLQTGVWLRTLVTALVGSWVIAALAQVTLYLPFNPVPFTLQNLGVFLVASLLGPRGGVIAVCMYLLQGAAGLPVFAGAHGGLALFLRPSGGYLLSYVPAAFVVGKLCQAEAGRLMRLLGFSCGWMMNLGLGWAWFSVIFGMKTALTLGVLPFLLPGVCKLAALTCAPNLGPYVCRWLSGTERS